MPTIYSNTKYKDFTKSKLIDRGYIIMNLPYELTVKINEEFISTAKEMVMTKSENNRLRYTLSSSYETTTFYYIYI